MPDLNRLFLNIMIYCMGGTLIALNSNTKEKKATKKTKHVINMNAQFETINNNN